MTMNLDLARKAIGAAIEHAQQMKRCCSVAVVDENGWLVALHRMDGALIPTADIAWDKAWTAAVFRLPSSQVSAYGSPSSPNFGFNTSNWNDRLTTIAGGMPIMDGSELIGAIGVSGGTPEEDVLVCQEAIAEIWG